MLVTNIIMARSERLQVRFTKEEMHNIRESSKIIGVTKSELVRRYYLVVADLTTTLCKVIDCPYVQWAKKKK